MWYFTIKRRYNKLSFSTRILNENNKNLIMKILESVRSEAMEQ